MAILCLLTTTGMLYMLQFIMLLMMDAKGVRNMQSILIIVNKHNTARVASCFIIYKEYIRDDTVVRKIGGKVNKIPTPCIHCVLCFLLFISGATPQIGPSLTVVKVSRSYKIRHTTPGMTPLNEGLARRRSHYLYSTQQTQETNSHILSGIRTPQSQQ